MTKGFRKSFSSLQRMRLKLPNIINALVQLSVGMYLYLSISPKVAVQYNFNVILRKT